MLVELQVWVDLHSKVHYMWIPIINMMMINQPIQTHIHMWNVLTSLTDTDY